MKTADYLQALRLRLTETDGKPATNWRMAKALKIRIQLMQKYDRGEAIPGPVVAFRLAEQLGEQPAAVVADLEAERAERDGKDEDASYLRAVLEQLRRVAAVAGASILLTAGMGGMLKADAGLRHAGALEHSNIVSRRRTGKPGQRRRRAGPWDQLLRAIVPPAGDGLASCPG